jgi:hypothetical protein
MFQSRRLCAHVIVTCHKVGILTYLKQYSKMHSPTTSQLIRKDQHALNIRSGRKNTRFGSRKQPEHRTGHMKAGSLLQALNEKGYYQQKLIEYESEDEEESDPYCTWNLPSNCPTTNENDIKKGKLTKVVTRKRKLVELEESDEEQKKQIKEPPKKRGRPRKK